MRHNCGVELILIRHGLPLRDESGIDPQLSPTGHRQARAVADWLADERIEAIYSSPLRRAVQTAQPLSDATGLSTVVEEDLREITMGEGSYIPLEQLEASHPLLVRWREFAADSSNELMVAFRTRVAGAVSRLIERHSGETVAVFCHGGVVNAATATLLGLAETLVFDIDYTSITRIRANRSGKRSVHCVNECGHLRSLRAKDAAS